MFYEFNGLKPIVHPSAFVHPQANVTGDVWIEEDVYIGPGAVLRGDWGRITVKKGANVQENCVVHVFLGRMWCSNLRRTSATALLCTVRTSARTVWSA